MRLQYPQNFDHNTPKKWAIIVSLIHSFHLFLPLRPQNPQKMGENSFLLISIPFCFHHSFGANNKFLTNDDVLEDVRVVEGSAASGGGGGTTVVGGGRVHHVVFLFLSFWLFSPFIFLSRNLAKYHSFQYSRVLFLFFFLTFSFWVFGCW
jgi:hypothetical protein